jgi:hypothetical protein
MENCVKKKVISLIATIGLLMTVGAVGATSAQAETRSIGSSTFVSPIVAKPNFVPPTDGGSTPPTPSNLNNGSPGRQFCYAVRVVTGFTTVWLIIGNVTKPVQVAVYGTEWICTMVYG